MKELSGAAANHVLQLLKARGAMTAQTLAAALDITPMGARQQLLRLQQRDLVASQARTGKVGRPARFFELTPAAWTQFPDRHEELTVQIIAAVREVFGDAGLERLVACRERDTEARYRHALAGSRNLRERVRRLVALRSKEGYMASFIAVGRDHFVLIEDHCPVCAAARQCQALCRSELALFRRCLDAEVERSEYLLDGARRCAYTVRAKSAASGPRRAKAVAN